MRLLFARAVVGLFRFYIWTGLHRRWCNYWCGRDATFKWPKPPLRDVNEMRQMLCKHGDLWRMDGPDRLFEQLPRGDRLEAAIQETATFESNLDCGAFMAWAFDTLKSGNQLKSKKGLCFFWVLDDDPWWRIRGHYVLLTETYGSGWLNYGWASIAFGDREPMRLSEVKRLRDSGEFWPQLFWAFSNWGSNGPHRSLDELLNELHNKSGGGRMLWAATFDPTNIDNWKRVA